MLVVPLRSSAGSENLILMKKRSLLSIRKNDDDKIIEPTVYDICVIVFIL